MNLALINKIFELTPIQQAAMLAVARLATPDPDWRNGLQSTFDITDEEIIIIHLMSQYPLAVRAEGLAFIEHHVLKEPTQELQLGAAMVAAIALVRCPLDALPEDLPAWSNTIWRTENDE